MPHKFKKVLRQPPYNGGRTPVHSGFIPDLERAIEREMRRFNVTRSFVIATCCAYALGIEEQPDYHKIGKSVLTVVPKAGGIR